MTHHPSTTTTTSTCDSLSDKKGKWRRRSVARRWATSREVLQAQDLQEMQEDVLHGGLRCSLIWPSTTYVRTVEGNNRPDRSMRGKTHGPKRAPLPVPCARRGLLPRQRGTHLLSGTHPCRAPCSDVLFVLLCKYKASVARRTGHRHSAWREGEPVGRCPRVGRARRGGPIVCGGRVRARWSLGATVHIQNAQRKKGYYHSFAQPWVTTPHSHGTPVKIPMTSARYRSHNDSDHALSADASDFQRKWEPRRDEARGSAEV